MWPRDEAIPQLRFSLHRHPVKLTTRMSLKKMSNPHLTYFRGAMVFRGKGPNTGNPFINASLCLPAPTPTPQHPASLTFRANQPEMGKVSSSSKNPRKLMRPWQRQDGQLSGASGDKRAEATTEHQRWAWRDNYKHSVPD